ncbi:MAG TPA: DUF429 domain-containing protein [Vicinamibacterales bacterium]|jgi:hypothetical protein
MEVFGIDFTSRPSRSKAITCAGCQFDGDRLVVEDLQRLESLDAFGAFLDSPGPWIAGIDFPFGQPRRLIQNLNWPGSWAGYVAQVAGLSREGFRNVLEDYKRDRPENDREHLRLVDRLTGAQSPSKLYGVPVALMFYEGSQRLLRSATCVIPVRPTTDDRVVVEAYPALVARTLVGKDRYKPAEPGDVQAVARAVRERIVQKLGDGSLFGRYKIRVELTERVRRACADDTDGDSLDAVLAAIQAAWAWVRRTDGYGVPEDCDLVEGWIVDPVTQPSVNSSITRVRPVFRRLFGMDPTGASWLPKLLRLSKSDVSGRMLSEPGTVLPAVSEKRPYADPVQGNIELERCFEFSVVPGASFLRWLIQNPDRLTWPGPDGRRVSYSATTQERREELVGLKGHSARIKSQAAAMGALDRYGPEKSGRKWWAFEGFTEVDCCIETDQIALLVEGKRTESLAESTAWYAGRNQLHRNLEAARDLAAGREFGVFIIGEYGLPDQALGDPRGGLPHLNDAERAELMTHYLGCLRWSQVCEVTGIDPASLPRNVARRVKRARVRSEREYTP